MEITKYTHACFVATKHGESLVVDPGELSPDFVVPDTVAGVVITHMHTDHWDAEYLARMQDAPIFAPLDAVEAMKEFGIEAEAVSAGDVRHAGEFTLTFTGGQHAVIHPSVPVCQNVGVLIDGGDVYYPGDSFALPDAPAIKTLALPVAAPWMKTSEGMDFLTELAPETAFPTHDAILTEAGKGFVDNWMRTAAEKVGTVYERL